MGEEKNTYGLIDQLKEIYSVFFDSEYISKNLVIPRLYVDSIETLKVKELFNQSSTLTNTKWGVELYGQEFLNRKKLNNLGVNDKIFLSIGEWGSKHQFLMCCDKSSQDFGKIFDYNDAHPWSASNNWEVEWIDFKEFIKDEYNVDIEL